MSFEFDVSTDVIDGAGSYQGDLASSYTNELKAYLQSTEGADYAAYLSNAINGLSIDDALAVKALIESGSFQLSGLFSAAQSKTGYVEGGSITDPTPTLTVTLGETVIVIDLRGMLEGTDTAEWNEITTLKKTVTTTFHTREFYTDSKEPGGYASDWSVVPEVQANQAPTADPITWDVTEYDEHAAAKTGTDNETINLLSSASDPDGDTMAVVAGSVMLDGGGALPSYLTFDSTMGELTIDRNSSEFDSLYLGDTLDLTITYDITDGQGHTITNTVDLTITGTADQFTGSTDVSASMTSGFNTTTWDGSFNFTLTAPTGAFDFAGTATVTATGDIDLNAADNANDEVVFVTLEGGTAVTLGAWDDPPNQETTTNYSTDSDTASFASNDATVTVNYDSNTAGGVNGVDGLSVVGASVTADYTYWL